MVLADVGRGDYVLSQVTSNPYSDPLAVPLSKEDFRTESLRRKSYARPGKLFTANRDLLRAQVGDLKAEAFDQLIRAVMMILQTGTSGNKTRTP